MKHPRFLYLALAIVMLVLTACAVLIVVERCERQIDAIDLTNEEMLEARR